MAKKPPAVHTVDFETERVQSRPLYPPVPVGVSIKRIGDKQARYYAWGHPTENNCTKAEARKALLEVWSSKEPILFHNAKFDVDVAEVHMGLPIPAWERIHETMFLLYLDDPHAPDLQLKPSAERVLGMAPDERDAVSDWIWENRKALLAEWPDYNEGKLSRQKNGAWICKAPGGLVGRYANGDVDRTEKLFKHLWPRVVADGMEESYDRERALMPILLANEREGLRVDLPALRRDVKLFTAALDAADTWLRRRLKSPNLSLDNDNHVAEALASAGIVRDEDWTFTASGERSVSKVNLRPEHYQDKRVYRTFAYRNRLTTCLKMFMVPWLVQAEARGGIISTNWNQVRGFESGSSRGTRTGRPSTNDPNFLNISKSWHDKDDGYEHPSHIPSLTELPLVRRYILPDKGGVFCHRDYNGQELRLLGHFEDAALMAAYLENPRMDVHAHVKDLILEIVGLDYQRTQVKITNFRRIYGGGKPATAAALNCSLDEAGRLLDAHGKALPGVKDLDRRIKAMAKGGEPIVTWGGRRYFAEEPKFSKKFGRHMTFEYKLLNYLIQGSAADVTKEAILRWHAHPQREGRFLVTVYDEINISAPKGDVKRQMAVLRECMESIEIDVPMISDGKTGPSWGALKKFVEPEWCPVNSPRWFGDDSTLAA